MKFVGRSMVLVVALSAVVLLVAGVGCPGSGDSSLPGDRFFECVVAGSGSNSGSNGAMNVILFDPANAGQREAGEPGSDPTKREAVALVYFENMDGAAELTGTYTTDGDFQLSGDGWTASGNADGSRTNGEVAGPNGEAGLFGGTDVAHTTPGKPAAERGGRGGDSHPAPGD